MASLAVAHPASSERSGERAAPGARSLDLHEGIASNGSSEGCSRWPAHFWLLSSHGELVPGRCRATNLCEYCSRLAAVENAEILALDAERGQPPTVYLTLTTASTVLNPAAFRVTRNQFVKALRARWPGLEFAWLWELTTGYAELSGGKRRLHGNVLLKHHHSLDLADVADLVEAHWCRREDAVMAAQYVGLVEHMGGLMRYLALHFQKESQAPPIGWKGHRFKTSKGYLWTSTPEAREAARNGLRLKRELWRAIRAGVPAEDVQGVAEAVLRAAADTTWRLIQLKPGSSDLLDPGRPAPAGVSEDLALELTERRYLRELARVRAA